MTNNTGRGRKFALSGNVSFLAGTIMKLAGEKIGPLSYLDPEIVREEKQGAALGVPRIMRRPEKRVKLNKSRRTGVWTDGMGAKYLETRKMDAGKASTFRKLSKAHRIGAAYSASLKKLDPKYLNSSRRQDHENP